MSWKVSHYYHNPKNNLEATFDEYTDALAELMIMQSDDPLDSQCSTIENIKTGEYGKRRWGQVDIDWLPPAAALGRKGGLATSEAKAAASRENGKRGGRPSAKRP